MSVFKKIDQSTSANTPPPPPPVIASEPEPMMALESEQIDPPPPPVAMAPVEERDPAEDAASEQSAQFKTARDHLRLYHGHFVSENASPIAVEQCHQKDHTTLDKTPFYKPHSHSDGSVIFDMPPPDCPATVPAEWATPEGVAHP